MTELAARLGKLLGSRVETIEQTRGGGYTPAGRYRVKLADGRRVFAKLATEELTTGWIREEYLAYANLEGPFIPELVAWDDDGEAPLLVLPDLGDCFSAPPWTPERIAAVLESLELLRATSAPALPSVERFAEFQGRWDIVAAEPEPFLSLGIASADWLGENVGALSEAAHAARMKGDETLHFDVRSDNTAFVDGRAVFVDWNWASRGNAELDVVAWLPSLAVEGGPEPDSVYDGSPESIALIAGVWASAAGLPPPPTADETLRAIQATAARVAVPWACRALGLPPPDGS
jgi:hypothetical protein